MLGWTFSTLCQKASWVPQVSSLCRCALHGSPLGHSMGISCPPIEVMERTGIGGAMAVSDLKIPVADGKKLSL